MRFNPRYKGIRLKEIKYTIFKILGEVFVFPSKINTFSLMLLKAIAFGPPFATYPMIKNYVNPR